MASHTPSQPAADSPLVSVQARDRVSLIGLLVVLSVVAATGTTRDLVVAVPLVVAAGLLPPPLAFVVGQLAVVPSLTLDATLAVGGTQFALLVVLTEPARDRAFRPATVATAGAYAVLLGILAAGLRESLLVAGAVLCLAVIVGTYLARRVTLVRLERVDPLGAGRDADGGGTGDGTADGDAAATRRGSRPPEPPTADDGRDGRSTEAAPSGDATLTEPIDRTADADRGDMGPKE